MELITAHEARAITRSRKQQIEKFTSQWRAKFNASVTKAAAGTASQEGQTSIFFEIEAGNSLLMEARDTFIAEVRDAKYKVSMHDSNDDNDYFVYKVEWSEAA